MDGSCAKELLQPTQLVVTAAALPDHEADSLLYYSSDEPKYDEMSYYRLCGQQQLINGKLQNGGSALFTNHASSMLGFSRQRVYSNSSECKDGTAVNGGLPVCLDNDCGYVNGFDDAEPKQDVADDLVRSSFSELKCANAAAEADVPTQHCTVVDSKTNSSYRSFVVASDSKPTTNEVDDDDYGSSESVEEGDGSSKPVDIEAVAELVRTGGVSLKGVLRLPRSLAEEVYVRSRSGQAIQPEPKPKHAAFKDTLPTLNDLGHLESDIKKFFKVQDVPLSERTKGLTEIRRRLFRYCRHFLMSDMNWTNRVAMERRLWRDDVYAVVEALRNYSNAGFGDSDFAKSELVKFANEASEIYLGLLDAYQEKFGVNLSTCCRNYPSNLEAPLAPFSRSDTNTAAKRKLLSCQRFLTALGDLQRYKQEALGNRNLQIAKRYFTQAIQLAPDHGAPYNRLAMVAIQEGRRLESIYYLVRCLAIESPIDSAANMLFKLLVTVLDEIAALDNNDADQLNDLSRLLQWETIRPDYKNWVKEMPTSKLAQRSVLSFCSVQLMLFNKQLSKGFIASARHALTQLNELYKRSENPLTAMQTMQMVLISIFNVHRSVQWTDNESKVLADMAVRMLLSLFGIFLTVLDKNMDHMMEGLYSKQARKVLPAVNIFSQWLVSWNAHQAVLIRPHLDWFNDELDKKCKWFAMARVCNRLRADLETTKKTDSCPAKKCRTVTLPEDLECACFYGTLPDHPVSRYLQQQDDNDECHQQDEVAATMRLRLNSLLEVANFIADKKMAFFYDDTSRQRFVGKRCSPTTTSAAFYASLNKSCIADDNYEFLRDVTTAEGKAVQFLKPSTQPAECSPDVVSLAPAMPTSPPQTLSSAAVDQTMQLALVDTNSLIDHMDAMLKLLMPKKITVLVPTIVFNELVSLRDSSDKEATCATARHTIKLLRVFCKISMYRLKAVTCSGSLLNTFDFAKNETDAQAPTNDDRIINICLALLNRNNSASGGDEGNGERRMQLMLVTEDRNLKIKARDLNLNVYSVPELVGLLADRPAVVPS